MSKSQHQIASIVDNSLSWGTLMNNEMDLARSMRFWILRTFQFKEQEVIIPLHIPFVQSHFE